MCLSAENAIVNALDRSPYEVEVVHLGETPNRVAEAENAGVKSVPALLLDGEVLHINHGAVLSALKDRVLMPQERAASQPMCLRRVSEIMFGVTEWQVSADNSD